MKTTKTPKIRLESHVSPIRYKLTLKPDLESSSFAGQEKIEINISKATKSITLHSKDLDIKTVEILRGKDAQFAHKISYDESKETATFTFKNILKKGKATLSIVWSGVISESLRGFYRSRYMLDGETKHIATTQFEATDARRAFPCFDEPAQKAIFDTSLIIKNDHTAISNTIPTSIREHEAGYKIVDFSSTPRMSTYLLAFIIGEFESIEGKTKDGTQIRVWTTLGKKSHAKFALDIAIKSLEFYNQYFDIPYPLPTLDMIAMPDFESAGMENWGAIVYRETAILIDEENSSLSSKQWVATVIAHEIAHQWFGNLVTMHWWTDLWLNEGFAEYIQNVCLDKLFPSWHVWELFLADNRLAAAMKLDSLENSHPIEVAVHHPNEISEIFDMISYAKGSAIIRMLSSYLGEEDFRDGLRHYLKKHSHKNTETKDLWKSFEKVSKKPVSKIMSSWTSKIGYPLVTLHKDKKSDKYIIEQERFFSSRLSAQKYQKSKNKTLWQIPLSYDNKDGVIGKLNVGESSFIRVRYDKEILENLKVDILNRTMPVVDRLGIIRDIFALNEGGYISTDEALEFVLHYKNETEYIIWSEISRGVNRIYNLVTSLADQATKERYHKFAFSLFSPLAKKMGFEPKEGEKHEDTFLRSLAIAQAGMYGDTSVIKKAQSLFKNKNKQPIRADIRQAVYSRVASNGGTKEWEEFRTLYQEEELHEQKERYAYALTSFRDKTLIARTLVFCLSGQVKDQDTPHLIAGTWQNPSGRELTWQFVKHNWPTILKRYGEGGHFLSRILSPLSLHTGKGDVADIKKFFSKNEAPGAKRTLEQSCERISSNIAWWKDDSKKIKNWLDRNFS